MENIHGDFGLVIYFHVPNKMKLNDVDFITEYNDNIIFLEYKNANIKNAVNPNEFVEKIKRGISKEQVCVLCAI